MRIPRVLKRFEHAWRGWRLAWRRERSLRIEVMIGILMIIVASMLPLALTERLFLFIVAVGVLVLELVNTSLEWIADLLKPRMDPYVEHMKDVMAAAVLLAACAAAIVGFALFFPHLSAFFDRAV